MSPQWANHDGILGLMENDAILYNPTAMEIYSVLAGDKSSLNTVLQNCSSINLPIRFSKLNSKLFLHFYMDKESYEIFIEPYVERKGQKIVIPVIFGKITDHYIWENTWFYIDNLSSVFIKLMFDNGIDNRNSLHLGQYLTLIKALPEIPEITVVDDVHSNLENKLINRSEIPVDINATLYPYQISGFNWMSYMVNEQFGCILGDEMGLGKTLQIITLIFYCPLNIF